MKQSGCECKMPRCIYMAFCIYIYILYYFSRYRVVRRPPLSARGGTAIPAKLKSSYFYKDSGPDRPRGRGGGADPDQDPHKIRGFWLGRDRRSAPPGGEENKILAKKTEYYTRKQNIKWVNKIFRIFCLSG